MRNAEVSTTIVHLKNKVGTVLLHMLSTHHVSPLQKPEGTWLSANESVPIYINHTFASISATVLNIIFLGLD